MTDTNEGERRRDLSDPIDTRSSSPTSILPLVILAAVVALIVFALAYREPTTERAGDTNAGPPVQTVTPAPSPPTSPSVPTPNPTTEQPNTPPAQ